jgi:hypothetical protein
MYKPSPSASASISSTSRQYDAKCPAGWATPQASVLSKTVDPMPMLLIAWPGSIRDAPIPDIAIVHSTLRLDFVLTFFLRL